MTAIVAVVQRGRGWIAGDRCVADEFDWCSSAAPKLVRIPGGAFGWAGDLAVAQAMAPTIAEELQRGRLALEALRAAMRRERPEGEASFLVVRRGRITILDSAGSAVTPRGNVAAIGSGGHAARGAAAALLSCGIEPRDACRRALKITAAFVNGVAGPFDVWEL